MEFNNIIAKAGGRSNNEYVWERQGRWGERRMGGVTNTIPFNADAILNLTRFSLHQVTVGDEELIE